jgi:hypothetical protein
MKYLLKESSLYFKIFQENLDEKDFEKYSLEARKRFEVWIKENFEFENPEVKTTLKP